MLEAAFTKALINAGVGAFIALFILFGLYRIVGRLGSSFIEAQQGQAEALGSQAQAIEGLTKSIRDYMGEDNTEHREMLVLLRFIAQKQQSFEEVRREHYERKKQAHTDCAARTA